MLKKLLKYDMLAVGKTWWILVVAFLGACLAGGFMIGFGIMTKDSVGGIAVLSIVLGSILLFFTLSAFLIVSTILPFIRFYKNLYTDEGYLTFTLPATRWEILISKSLSTIIFMAASVIVTLLGIFAFVGALCLLNSIDLDFRMLAEEIAELFAGDAMRIFWIVVVIVFGLLCLIALLSAWVAFVELCISVGCMLAQKHKLLASIGIYYGANMVLSFATQTLGLLGNGVFIMIYQRISPALGENAPLVFAFLVMVILLVFVTAAAFGLYCLTHRIMEKRLNLA